METKLLFEVRFGSIVYGTSLPTSDIDVGRVYLESEDELFGLKEAEIVEQVIDKENNTDTRIAYLKRFLRLCVKGNPNVLEWLYTPKEHIIYLSDSFKEILDNRDLFLNINNTIPCHFGFAKSQVIKMKKHEKTMGAKRKELCEKFGYDTKFAHHALRLCWQLDDIIEHNKIILPYPEDRCNVLKSIKLGGLSLGEFELLYENVINSIDKKINNLHYDSVTDHKKITKILKNIYEIYRQT